MTGVAPVRAFVRVRTRRRRSWSDRYVTLLSLGLLVMLVSPAVGRAVAAVPTGVDPARAGAGLALIALVLAVALTLARVVGPVGASAADAAWLVLSPLPRRGVLAPALLVLALVCAVVGACLGLALLGAVGAPDALTLRLFVSVVMGLSWTLGGMAVTVLAQASQAWDDRLAAVLVVLVVAALAMAVTSLGPGQGALTALATAPPAAWASAASGSAAAAMGLVWRAWTRVARIPARAVLAASARTELASGAFVAMDPGTLTWVAEDAHWRSRTLRSCAWPSWLRGAAAVAWPDWLRLARRPGLLALMAGAAVLPPLTARVGGGMPVTLTVLAAGAMAVAATGTTGARRDAGDASLVRLLGAGPRALLAARAVLPALLGGAWLTLALAGLDLAGHGGLLWPFGLLCAPALAAGGLRLARRRPVEHSMPVLDSPLGPVPLGPLVWALTGADIAILGCLPALVACTTGVTGPLLAAQAVWAAAVLAAYCAAPRRA
ncbi:DUF6297 family protein [Nocardiopsis aegyptia]